jgi:hypothetical protein
MRILFFRETWNMADKAEMSNDNALAWGWRGEPKSSLEELLRLADADPLALNSPTPEDMRETVRRAKIASHVLVDSKEFVPELTKDESAQMRKENAVIDFWCLDARGGGRWMVSGVEPLYWLELPKTEPAGSPSASREGGTSLWF